jgi:hypothetical protein
VENLRAKKNRLWNPSDAVEFFLWHEYKNTLGATKLGFVRIIAANDDFELNKFNTNQLRCFLVKMMCMPRAAAGAQRELICKKTKRSGDA